MKSELIVDVRPTEIETAILEDGRLAEAGKEKREQTFSVGNIYLGTVKKVMPSLNAVFVDIGHEKDAFLHYLDLGISFLRMKAFLQAALGGKISSQQMDAILDLPDLPKEGQIQELLQVGDKVLVEIAKEAINTKGPRLTAEISLAGRNMVLMPITMKVMVSNKIKAEGERSRLRQLVQSIKSREYGVIVRTLAEGKRVAELDKELKLLISRWEAVVETISSKPEPPVLLSEEIGRTIGIIRDLFTPEFEAIVVNDEQVYKEIVSYIRLIAPDSEKIIHLYRGEQPIFDYFDVSRQLKVGFGRTVGFKNGGYLVMERTEALFSIDVNSGSKKLGEDPEENAFQFNMLAADEIVHQLRLRDIGGIIIVDFIDMDSAEHQNALYEHVRELMKNDRAKHNILKLSKFCLMQITRQRVRPAVEIVVQEECPVCHGKGKIQPSLFFVETLEEKIGEYKQQYGSAVKRLYVHPFVYAYLAQGWLGSQKWKWRWRYGIKVLPNQQLNLLGWDVTDRKGVSLNLTATTDK
ncbi:MAG: Rne/Rng family ribonuclease [Paludibacteraceae bacterium]|nr:Rne/Rng family ribonuclease [Paludibacteraceae bacterium]